MHIIKKVENAVIDPNTSTTLYVTLARNVAVRKRRCSSVKIQICGHEVPECRIQTEAQFVFVIVSLVPTLCGGAHYVRAYQ